MPGILLSLYCRWFVAKVRSNSCDSVNCSRPGCPVRGMFRQECWSGVAFPSPGDLPNPGIKPVSPVLAGGFFTTGPSGKPSLYC